MSLTENIGGFFVSLGLVTDRKSFNDGINGIKGLETSVKKIIGTAGAAATALTGLGAAASHLETDAMKTAHAIGISYQNIDKWRTAVSLAGVSAKGLTSEMLNLENKMQRLKLGDVDSGLAKTLGLLRINYGQFADMTAEERMTAVFGSASRMQDQRKAALLVGDALGSAAQEYYRYLQMTDRTLEDELANSQRLVFTDDRTKRDAVEFMYELKGLTSAVKSIGSLLGAEVGRQLTPVIRNIKEIIARNKELIKTGIIGFVDAAGKAFSAAVGVMERVGPVVGSLIDKLGGLDRVIEGIGIGILTIKAAGVVGGIAKIISSMGLLKTAIAGLGLGALYLLVEDIMVYFKGTGRSVTGEVVEGIKKFREAVNLNPDLSGWETLSELAKNLLAVFNIDYDESGLKALIESHPEWGEWEKIGATFGQILNALGIDVDATKFAKLGGAAKKLVEAIKGDSNISVGEWFGKVAGALGDLAAVSLTAILNGAAELVGPIRKLIGAVTNGKDFTDWLGDVFTEVTKFAAGVATGAINAITGLVQPARNLVQAITGGESVGEWLGKVANGLLTLAGDELSAAITTATGLFEALSGIWNGDWDKAVDGAKKMVKGIQDAIQGLVDWIKGGESWEEILSGKTGVRQMIVSFLADVSGDEEYSNVSAKFNSLKNRMNTELNIGLFETGITKDSLKNLSYTTLTGLKEWLDAGGTVDAFKKWGRGQWDESITAEDVLWAWETARFKGSKNDAFRKLFDMDYWTQDSLLPAEQQVTSPSLWNKLWEMFTGKDDNKVFDGIIQPGGGITRVAPDDWVFAVRNVADLAAAFMPSAGYSAGDQTITVNQTVNIQGGTNLAPATISQAAKQGVHGALQEMMSRSVNRYQMMSGMR